MGSDIKKKAAKAMPHAVGITISQIVLAMLWMVLGVRHLDGDSYSAFALIIGIPVMLNAYLSFGYDASILRFVPAMEEGEGIGNYIWGIAARRISQATLACILMVATFQFWAPRFSLEGYFWHLVLAQAFIIADVGYFYLAPTLHARFLQRYVLILSLVMNGLRLAGAAIGVFLDLDVFYFIGVFSATSVLNFFGALVVFSRFYGWPRFKRFRQKVEETGEERSYRWISYVNNIGMSFLDTNIDRYVLAAFANPIEVAIYVVATRVMAVVDRVYPQQMFKSVVAPAFYSKYDETESDTDLDRMFRFLFNANSAFGFMVLAVFLPIGRDLLRLVFKQDYAVDSYWVLVLFLVFVVVYTMPLALVVKAIKQPKILLWSKVTIVLNLALGIPLAKWYGAFGMAIATVIANVLKNVIIYLMLLPYTKVRIPWFRTAIAIFDATLTSGVVYLVMWLTGLHAILGGVLGLVVFVVLNKLIPVLEPEERKLALSLVPKRFRKVAARLI